MIRTLGQVALVAGGAQVVIVAGGGLLLSLALGLGAAAALYVGIGGLAFSSTITVVKLLSDRRELDDLHGRPPRCPASSSS